MPTPTGEPPYHYTYSRCCVKTRVEDDFNARMLKDPPKAGSDYKFDSLQAFEYWCLNVGGALLHRERIVLDHQGAEGFSLDLREFSFSAFRIFHHWVLDFRLPFIKTRSDRWSPDVVATDMHDEVALFEAYSLGWRLGAVVFTNQLMSHIAAIYDPPDVLPPPFCAFYQAFNFLHFRNPMCKFLVQSWYRKPQSDHAQEMERLRVLLDGRVFKDAYMQRIVMRLHYADDLPAPDSFTRHICRYHTHFLKGNDIRRNWTRHQQRLEVGLCG
ncbi:uncharacterized protein J3D65DRAFT_680089 [Phyllosticta citribraziliensis]|uniref:Uncharacterized protein n=1 Tax=Phyllosticta citribraziliensis TaxID=989973 RepID=A0ABR1LF43_9PEZI